MTAHTAPRGRYGLPIAWMCVIAVLSGDRFSAEATGSWLVPLVTALVPGASPPVVHGLHLVLRKLGHVVEFGVLGVLWLHALAPGGLWSGWEARRAIRAIGLAALYAVVDEARQGLTVSRSPSWLDVGLDTAGAWLAVAGIGGSPRLAGPLLRVARFLAALVAVGSLAAALVDGALGLTAWDAGLAAVGASGAALALHRAARNAEISRRGPLESFKGQSRCE